MSQIIHVPAAMLSVSPLNVRTTRNEQADLQLRDDIIARGVLQNLIGMPVPRKKGRYEITGGGRRLAQIHAAIASNDLDADFLVPLLVIADRDDAEEASLAENFQRLNMNPADECIAFRHIIAREKRTPADIAKRFGLTERFVLGRIRLAGLADVVFEALREGEITLDVATAYAATSDTAQQAAVFEDVSRQSYAVHPDTIRRRVLQTGYTPSLWKVRLIARDDYIAAGGRIDADLFSDHSTEILLDRDIVDRLAAARLDEVARDTREANGFASVRVVEDEREIWSEARHLDVIEGTAPEPTEQAVARQAEIEALLEAYEAREEDPDAEPLTDEEETILEGLREEHSNLDDPAPVLTDEEKSRAIAFIYPAADGKVYLYSRIYAEPLPIATTGEHLETQHDDMTGNDRPAIGDVIVTQPQAEKSGISQRLASELAIQKTELIALHVANDPHFALDLGIFIMADRVETFSYSDIPSELRASTPSSSMHDFTSESQAAHAWSEIDKSLDRSWTSSKSCTERFDAFCALNQDAKAAWLGWCIARTLRPVDHGGPGGKFLDHLGRSLEIDPAAWWRPTAANFFDRVPKSTILCAFEQVGGVELKGRYAAAKKADLAAAAEKLFHGDMMIEVETKAAAVAWVPPSMSFAQTIDERADDADEGAVASDGTGASKLGAADDHAEHEPAETLAAAA